MNANQPGVQIVTDSTADFPDAIFTDLPITVVPLSVEIEGTIYRDGIDLTRDEFLAYLQTGVVPRTSQPSVGTFQEAYQPILERGQEIVSVHLSGSLSGTINSATQATQLVGADRITLVDSGTASMGTGFLAIEAARMAKDGASAGDIAGYLERRKVDQRLFATLQTLEFLRKGGRIGRASAMLGSALQLKPIVQIRDGVVEPVERVRTYRRALDRLAGIYAELAPFDHVAVLHLGAPNEAERLVERIREHQPDIDVVTGQIGTVIGAYGGPGLVGFTGLVSSSTSP